VVSPTKVARSNEAEARMMVPQRLPASRDAVEKRAAAKASVRPTRASRNRIQIWDSPIVFRKDDGDEGRVRVSLAEMALLSRMAPLCWAGANRIWLRDGLGEVTEGTGYHQGH